MKKKNRLRFRLSILTLALTSALTLTFLTPTYSFAATGCSYPTSLDSYADKQTGDYLTVADINSRSCAIEKLESGPLQPNVGSVSAPAYSFRNDTDTGMYWVATNELGFSTGASRALHLKSSRIFGGNTTGVTTGSNAGDAILANTNGYRFLNLAGTSSIQYGIESTSTNSMLVRVPDVTSLIELWAGTFKMAAFGLLGDGNGSYFQLTEASTTPSSVPANTVRIFAQDNGSGKTRICAQFSTGAAQCFATEP